MRRISPILLLLLAACANLKEATQATETKLTDVIAPYRIDVRQGNFVTQDMVAQLKPGLTKDQVRFILGTPLIADPFHVDRWDYAYRFQRGRGKPQQRQLIVFFEDGKLARVGGDVAASESGTVEAAPPEARVIDIAAEPDGQKAGSGTLQPEQVPDGKPPAQ